MPKEATCDVECAMKVESLRILTKKRKQSQRGDGSSSAASPKGGGGGNPAKGIKRSLSNSLGPGSPSGTNSASLPMSCDSNGNSSAGVLPTIPAKEGSIDGGMTLNSSSSSSSSSKEAKESARRRFVWSVPLHQDFVAAVFDVGLKCASPKLLLEMMPVVDGLTSEHIKSHLQKYRLHRQRSREEFLKSYGYLTDLDGGKGLGGGSAAATIKAAASAAAGDVKPPFPGCIPDRPLPEPEEKGCASSCGCNDTDDAILGGGGGQKDEEGDGKFGPKTAAAAAAVAAAGSPDGAAIFKGMAGPAASGGCAGGDGGKPCCPEDAGKETCAGSGGERPADAAEAAAADGSEASQPQPEVEGGAVQAVTSAMLQSHLELLARGIDLQVKFHHHLREVVESQQTLQAQLLGKQGHPLPPHLIDTGSPRELTTTTEMATPTIIGFPRIGGQQLAGAGAGLPHPHARLKECNQVPKLARSVAAAGAGAGAGVRNMHGGPRQSAPASSGSQPWVVSGGEDFTRALASAGRAHRAVDAMKSKGTKVPGAAGGGDSMKRKPKALVTDAPGTAALSGPSLPSPTPPGPALSSPVLSSPELSGPALSGPALPAPALSGPAFSGPARSGATVSGPSLSSPSLSSALSGPALSAPALPGRSISGPARARTSSGSSRNSTSDADSRGKTGGDPGQPPPQLQMGPSPIGPSPMRASFSPHSATGGQSANGAQSLPPRYSSMARQGAGGVVSRGYVPGEFTLISKSSETGAGGGGPSSHARGTSEAMKIGAVGRGGGVWCGVVGWVQETRVKFFRLGFWTGRSSRRSQQLFRMDPPVEKLSSRSSCSSV